MLTEFHRKVKPSQGQERTVLASWLQGWLFRRDLPDAAISLYQFADWLQHGHDCAGTFGSAVSAPAASSGFVSGIGPASSWRARAMFPAREPLANKP